ncbi:YceI family protein [Chitinophaga pendula]|uniref:YceI family protein n=1 Tax=Chitinophaga TaxID=79328 RepID=UPI000BAEAB34|nr:MULTISPECIES: YceI family protein [Chitinophaga]ASZ09951.1 lipid-binding protein [Chitinophaga sp. MD30]UCJ07107.1 YceI family protein [Chitinophaga pendula]
MKYAASYASIGVLAIITAFTIQVSAEKGNPLPAAPIKVNTAVARKAATYHVDVQHSQLTWTGHKVTGQHSGNIAVSKGDFNVENNKVKSGSFQLDTRSITVTDITDKDGNSKLLGHLKGDDFFAVEKYPSAAFVTTSITPGSGNSYDVKGKLTIKGITQDISFPATITVDNNQLVAKANIKVDRTKYDIKFHSKRFFDNLGDKVIYDDFDLDITLVAKP